MVSIITYNLHNGALGGPQDGGGRGEGAPGKSHAFSLSSVGSLSPGGRFIGVPLAGGRFCGAPGA